MDHYRKMYYALNNSKTKHILLSLVRDADDTFTPLLHLYSDKDGCRMTLRQYIDFCNASPVFLEFLDGKSNSTNLDLSNENIDLNITGRQSTCRMLIFKQIDLNHTSVVCMAKRTFENLLLLRPIIQRTLMRYEDSMDDIRFASKKYNDDGIIINNINIHGFDLTTFALELKHFANGVHDSVCNG
jgi:hypothetical protein